MTHRFNSRIRAWVGVALASALWLAGAAQAQEHRFDRGARPGWAQGPGRGDPHGPQRGWGPSRGPGPGPGFAAAPGHRPVDRPMPPQRYRPPPPPVVIYGHHGFRPGGFVPPGYVVVDRWQRYPRLAPPPRGYRWVRSGADFALVAIASGIIASVILNGD